MTQDLSRRTFVGATLIASTVAIAPGAVVSFLSHPDAPARVFAILSKHLPQVTESQRDLVAEFTLSLQTTATHHQSAAAFAGKLAAAAQDPAALELYVVEEFVISTNFLAYASGKADGLKMLPVGADGRRTAQPLVGNSGGVA